MTEHRSGFRFLSADAQILLALYSGPLAANDIYRCVSASQPTISKRLSNLMTKGLVGLGSKPDDRRVNMYFITPEGHQMLRQQIEEKIGPILLSLAEGQPEDNVVLRYEDILRRKKEGAGR